MREDQIHLSHYVVTLAPDDVRFLKFTDFLEAEVDVSIEALRKLSLQPRVSSPSSSTWKGLDLEAIDALCPGGSWEARLRIHHALGKLYFQHDAPTCAYSSFHVSLALNEYNYEEFISAWVLETLGNRRLMDSLAESPDHILLVRAADSLGYIFRKTPFVLARLRAVRVVPVVPVVRVMPVVRVVSDENKKRADAGEREAKLLEQSKSVRTSLLQTLRKGIPMKASREAKLQAQEAERLAKEEAARRISLPEESRYSGPSYTITLAPGVVRYLAVTIFQDTDVERWIDALRDLSSHPKIRPPSHLNAIDELLPDLSWEDRLRMHHALWRLYPEHGVGSYVYWCFHSELKLTAPALDACLNAWVKEAWDKRDVAESYRDASEYLVLPRNASSNHHRCVFRKTPFVAERLGALEQEAQINAKRQLEAEAARKETQDLDRLLKSNFSTFVYVMEDLRNGRFKIGRSKSPAKRERTLQSEVPQIVLRLSIPADEEHERELHDHFANKRLRGEWFSLTPDDLQWLVSFLRRNGDVARASIDYQWLGTIVFNAPDNRAAK